jgi:hypothetical protein
MVSNITDAPKVLHYYGNESSESLLEAYGILPKDQQIGDVLKPKQCPNCNEANRPDGKFCSKCRMVLTYDTYNETLEEQKLKEQEKDNQITKLQQQIEQLIQAREQESQRMVDNSKLIKNLTQQVYNQVGKVEQEIEAMKLELAAAAVRRRKNGNGQRHHNDNNKLERENKQDAIKQMAETPFGMK